jgi:hypothetical protein
MRESRNVKHSAIARLWNRAFLLVEKAISALKRPVENRHLSCKLLSCTEPAQKVQPNCKSISCQALHSTNLIPTTPLFPSPYLVSCAAGTRNRRRCKRLTCPSTVQLCCPSPICPLNPPPAAQLSMIPVAPTGSVTLHMFVASMHTPLKPVPPCRSRRDGVDGKALAASAKRETTRLGVMSCMFAI